MLFLVLTFDARFVILLEEVFIKYSSQEVLWFIEGAKSVSDYKTMQMSNGDAKMSPQIFSSLAVGQNVTLASHTDKDFFYKVVTVLSKNYNPENNHDRVLAYFAFPDANLSVPLRHGSVFIFNPRCRHSISSRKNADDTLLTVSVYTKTSNGKFTEG